MNDVGCDIDRPTVAEPSSYRLMPGVFVALRIFTGLRLPTPIWLMLLPAGGYLWEYAAEDLFPLIMAPRVGYRWPF